MNFQLFIKNNFLNILISLFLTTIILVSKSAAETNQTPQEKLAIFYNQKWTNELNDFLINHEDNDIRMIGLSESISSFNYSKKDLKTIDFKDIAENVNNMVANEKLNTQSLMIASEICSTHPKIEESCDSELINEKLILSDPNNLVVYINSLTQAFINDDREEIDDLVHSMANSHFAKDYSVTPEKFDSIIKQYVKDNPFYKEKIDLELNYLKTSKHFSKTKLQEIEQNPDEYLLLSRLINYQFTIPIILRYRTIIDTCKNSYDLKQTCINIAKAMIKSNHAYTPKVIGLHILITAYNNSNQKNLVEQFTIEKDNYKSQLDCYRKIMNISDHSSDRDYEMAYYNLYHQTIRELGLFDGYKKMAELNYKKQTEFGNKGLIISKFCLKNTTL
jgi:hypothetical protein